MSEQDAGASWVDRIRRWLWLDRGQVTDRRDTSRGFYPGGHPIYVNRKPVGRRFLLGVTAVGIVIGLVLLTVRDVEAQAHESASGTATDDNTLIRPPVWWLPEAEVRSKPGARDEPG